MDEQTTIERVQDCESGLKGDHGTPKLRHYKVGWNGYEAPYDESLYLCDDCYEAYREEM